MLGQRSLSAGRRRLSSGRLHSRTISALRFGGGISVPRRLDRPRKHAVSSRYHRRHQEVRRCDPESLTTNVSRLGSAAELLVDKNELERLAQAPASFSVAWGSILRCDAGAGLCREAPGTARTAALNVMSLDHARRIEREQFSQAFRNGWASPRQADSAPIGKSPRDRKGEARRRRPVWSARRCACR